MARNKNTLDEALGLLPEGYVIPEIDKAPKLDFKDDDWRVDYENARQNLHDYIVKGNQVLEHLMLLAFSQDRVGAYEMLAMLLKTQVDNNMQLLALQAAIRKMDMTTAKHDSNSGGSSSEPTMIRRPINEILADVKKKA